MIIKVRKSSSDTWYEIPGLGMNSTFKQYKTWAPNSGRALSGTSTGRVQYRKWKAFVKCPMLTAAQYAAMQSFFCSFPDYFFAQVIDDTGTMHSLTMYSGDLEYSGTYICGQNEVYYQGVSIELVEE